MSLNKDANNFLSLVPFYALAAGDDGRYARAFKVTEPYEIDWGGDDFFENVTSIKSLEDKGFLGEARDLWREGIDVLDDTRFQGELYYHLACSYINSDDVTDDNVNLVEGYLDKAIKLRPDDVVARYERGWFYAGEERYHEAEQEFFQCLRIKPDDQVTFLGLAVLYQDAGFPEAARGCLWHAQQIAPTVQERQRRIVGKINRVLQEVEMRTGMAASVHDAAAVSRAFEQGTGLIAPENSLDLRYEELAQG